MRKYRNHSLTEYVSALAKKAPTPGGGSAAAYTAAMGASLIAMVGQYSLGKGKSKAIEKRLQSTVKQAKAIQKRLLELVDLDAAAYLKFSKTPKEKKREKQLAAKAAAKIPQEVCKLCAKAVYLTPLLVKEGNTYLLSDVEVAIELLLASHRSAKVLTM